MSMSKPNESGSKSRRRAISAAIFTIAAVALSATTPRTAGADEDPFTAEALRELGWLNKDCGTNITLAPLDVAGFKAKSGGSVAPCKIFSALRPYCSQDSGKPHPAGQAFIKQNVKTISCTMTADTDKPEVKLSINSGTLAYSISPKWAIGDETKKALASDPTFKAIHEKRRVWDLHNVQVPEQMEKLKEGCGQDIRMTIDVPSFQARGYLTGYPDLAVADVCMSYAYGIYDACKEDKTATVARVKGIRCSLMGKEHEQNFKPQIVVANGEVTVRIGNTNAGHDNRMNTKQIVKSAPAAGGTATPQRSPVRRPRKASKARGTTRT